MLKYEVGEKVKRIIDMLLQCDELALRGGSTGKQTNGTDIADGSRMKLMGAGTWANGNRSQWKTVSGDGQAGA